MNCIGALSLKMRNEISFNFLRAPIWPVFILIVRQECLQKVTFVVPAHTFDI